MAKKKHTSQNSTKPSPALREFLGTPGPLDTFGESDLPNVLDAFEWVLANAPGNGVIPHMPPVPNQVHRLLNHFEGRTINDARAVMREFRTVVAARLAAMGADPEFVAGVKGGAR